jgi:Ca-activated chloride channel homolog
MRLPRQIKNSLLPLLLVFAAQKVCAQLAPADDFFNGGAQLYISNNIPAALEKTEAGLQFYPNDERLKKLEQLLKQQQQQQSQQNQQQQNQQQQQSQSQQNSKSRQNQQPSQPQNSSQNSPEQKKPDEQKQNPADQKKAEKQAEQKKSDDEKNQNGGNQTAAGQMTPEEAKRLLDAQKGNEQVLQLKPQGKPGDQNRPIKDW